MDSLCRHGTPLEARCPHCVYRQNQVDAITGRSRLTGGMSPGQWAGFSMGLCPYCETRLWRALPETPDKATVECIGCLAVVQLWPSVEIVRGPVEVSPECGYMFPTPWWVNAIGFTALAVLLVGLSGALWRCTPPT